MPRRFFPNSWGSWREGIGAFFREFNTCHDTRGRFCSRGAERLAPATPDAHLTRPGVENIFAMEPDKVRRFLYNPKTNQLLLGETVDEGDIWETDLHGEILENVLGNTGDFDTWTRGYIHAPRTWDALRSTGFVQMDHMVGEPAEVFEKMHATALALSKSGARANVPARTAQDGRTHCTRVLASSR